MDKITKKSCVPAIRFKGFTDTWEQRKLGDICPTFLDGDWIESKDQSDSGVRLIQTGNIGVGTYIEKEDRAKWVSEDTFNRLHCEELFAGDILISRLPEPAGRACIVPETGLKMITAVDVTIARTSDEYDSNFILQFLCSDNYFKAVGNTLSGSTRQRISRSNLEQIPVPIAPTMQEQEQVGAFFSQLDNLITLHQRKLDKLHNVKKSLLEKMFPKNGADKPEIRFKGFTHTWEQRELRTAATFSKGSGYSKNDLKENGTPIILYGRLYTKYETVISDVDTFVDVQPNSVYSTGHEVIVPASGETAEDISRASFVAKSGILLGGDLNIIVPDDYINPVFLALTISNGNQQKELSKRAQGKSVVHIHNSDLENVVLLYPRYEEQEKIGEYFSKLDTLITLHQRKLEKLRQIKKSMLEKMFV